MAKIQLGATLVLRNGNFYTNMQSAVKSIGSFKAKLLGIGGGTKDFSNKVKTAGTSVKGLIGKLAGIAAVAGSAKALVDFGKSTLEAANEQIFAEQRLERLMLNVKGNTKAGVDNIKAYADELKKVTTLSGDTIIAGASQLATFGLNEKNIKTLIPVLNDLAVGQYGVNVSQEQMMQSANLLGKVMYGQVGALSEAGIVFDETQKEILKNGTEAEKAAAFVEIMKVNFGGLAETMAQTPEGRIQQFKNAWDDVKEEIGKKLYPLVTDFLGFLAQYIPKMSDMLLGLIDRVVPVIKKGIDAVKPMMQSAFSTLTDKIFPTIDSALKSFKPVIKSVFSLITQRVIPAIGRIMEKMKGPFAWLGESLEVVRWAFEKSFGGNTGKYLENIASNLLPAIGYALGALIDAAAGVMIALSYIFKPVLWLVSGIVDKVKEFIDLMKYVYNELKPHEKLASVEVVRKAEQTPALNPALGLSFKWNAAGGILTAPTIFGKSGNTLFGGGEAGHEAVLPLDLLWSKMAWMFKAYAPVPAAAATNNNYTVNVNVDGSYGNVTEQIAKEIVWAIRNM